MLERVGLAEAVARAEPAVVTAEWVEAAPVAQRGAVVARAPTAGWAETAPAAQLALAGWAETAPAAQAAAAWAETAPAAQAAAGARAALAARPLLLLAVLVAPAERVTAG
jgi:hypothetical protein